MHWKWQEAMWKWLLGFYCDDTKPTITEHERASYIITNHIACMAAETATCNGLLLSSDLSVYGVST